jgi:uncharacterized protein YyaL (SSP411 family)
LTSNAFYRAVAEETLDYVLREMTSPEGGFYSTQDADSEGHEGRFYIWTAAELRETLGNEDGDRANRLLGASERGNFEGSNVLSIPDIENRTLWRTDEFTELRGRLYDARARRIRPGRDDKVLTSWNGMMLRAFATAAWVFDSPHYAEAARANARFVRDHLYVQGRLLRSYKDGQAKLNGYLEDYANYVDGLLALYQATFEAEWIQLARDLAHVMVAEFHQNGVFYDTSASHEQLISRPRDTLDNATPSGNSVACDVLLRLAHLTGDVELGRIANGALSGYARLAAEQPSGFSRLLCAADFALGPTAEVAITGDPAEEDTRALLAALRRELHPRVVVAVAPEGDSAAETIPLLAQRPQRDGRATAYVCINYACQLPTTDAGQMVEQLHAATSARHMA